YGDHRHGSGFERVPQGGIARAADRAHDGKMESALAEAVGNLAAHDGERRHDALALPAPDDGAGEVGVVSDDEDHGLGWGTHAKLAHLLIGSSNCRTAELTKLRQLRNSAIPQFPPGLRASFVSFVVCFCF